MPQGKILVIRGGAIGDFVLTLPVLSALRLHFPNARLEVLGYPHIVQLALAGGLSDAVTSIEARALAGFFARNGSLDAALAKYFEGFNLILSYLYDPDEIFQTNVARCTKAQFIAGPHRPSENSAVHATDVFLKPLERLAIFDADPVPRLRLEMSSWSVATEGEAAETGDGSRISNFKFQISNLPASASGPSGNGAPPGAAWLAAHPGSGSERKNWPEEKWAQLLRELVPGSRLDILLAGGEAEGGRLFRLAAQLPSHRIELAHNLPLVELARRLSACAAFIGHDSGISHIAGALGLRSLVLWGETSTQIWRPRQEQVVILEAGANLAALSVERVKDEIVRLLGC